MTCRTLVYAAFRPSSRLASSKKSLDRAFARARSKSSFPESDDFGSKPRKPSQYKSVGVDGAYPTYIARAYFKNPPKFLEDEEDEIYHPPSWEDIYDRHLARRREELEELESAASTKEQVGSSQVAKEESSDTGEETTSGDVPVDSKSAALTKEQIDSSQLAANEETTSGDEPVDSKSAALTKDQIVSSQLAAEESSDANEETTSGYEPNSKSPAEAYRDNVHKHRLLPLEVPQFTDEVPAWFEANDFERFIVPLYQRGWQLQFEKNLSVDIVSLVLKDRVFTFRSWKQAMVFTEFATDIANIQNHHPDAVNAQAKGRLAEVRMSLKTHHTRRCQWVHHDELRAPGVTIRDIRLAVLFERLYIERFGGGAPNVLPPISKQPPINIIHKLLNIAPKKLDKYCTACGGPHLPEKCKEGDDTFIKRFLPLCNRCHQRHAPMGMCPKTRSRFVKPPEVPCPNCGGAHWLADCRKPQLPPAEAQALMLPLGSEMTLEN